MRCRWDYEIEICTHFANFILFICLYLIQDTSKARDDAEKAHSTQMASLQTQHKQTMDSTTASLNKQRDDLVAKLEAEHKTSANQIKEKHSAEIAALTKQFGDEKVCCANIPCL
jgi:hypothetical protein